MSGVIDAFGVCGVCLADLLEPILIQEQRRLGRGPHGLLLAGGNYRQSQTVGAVGVLAKESGVNPRRIHGIITREFATVGLSNADALLCALDRPDLVHALDVFPRPRGRRLGNPGEHVCTLVADRRLAALEPSLTAGSRLGDNLFVHTSDGEADAPAVREEKAA